MKDIWMKYNFDGNSKEFFKKLKEILMCLPRGCAFFILSMYRLKVN